MLKRHATLLFLGGLLLVVGVVVAAWVTALLGAGRGRQEAALQVTAVRASVWRATLETQLRLAFFSANTVAGFIAGVLPSSSSDASPAPSTAPNASLINPARFASFASDLLSSGLGVVTVQIQPLGVTTLRYPPGSADVAWDFTNATDTLGALDSLGNYVLGPVTLSLGDPGYVVYHPVFTSAARAGATWWGAATTVVRTADLINASGLAALETVEEYLYLLENADSVSGVPVVVARSAGGLPNPAAAAIAAVRLPNGAQWTLTVSPADPVRTGLSRADIGTVAGSAVAIAVGGVLLGLLARWLSRRERPRDLSAAPLSPPVTLLFTDIESSTTLWTAHPKAMALALALHNQIIEGCARRLKAYVVKTIGDSFMIACKTDEMAVALAIAIMEAIETCNRWPPGLPAPGLRVRIGAHRCTEVDCHFEEVAQGYDYFGPDVNKAARVMGQAAGGAIVITEEVAQGATIPAAYSLVPLGQRVLRGTDCTHALYRLAPQERAASPRPGFGARSSSVVVPVVQPPSTPSASAASDAETRSRRLVGAVLDLSGGAAADAAPLLQWLALGARVLRLAVDPLGDADKAQTIQLLCAAWGLKAAVADASIEPLALRIVQVMRLLYPRLFESQQATDPSPGAARDGDHEDENEAPSDAEAQAE